MQPVEGRGVMVFNEFKGGKRICFLDLRGCQRNKEKE